LTILYNIIYIYRFCGFQI